MIRAWKRLFAAALMLPLVLLAVSSPTYAAVACAMRGLVVDSCCCGPDARGAPRTASPSGAEVASAPCCTVVELQIERAPSVPVREQTEWSVPVWATVATPQHAAAPLDLHRVRSVVVAWEAEPPPDLWPLLLKKQSFLI